MPLRFVAVIDWRPDLAGGHIEVFGTWRTRAAAQKALDGWAQKFPPELVTECEPITHVRQLGGGDSYDFGQSLRRELKRISHLSPTEHP